MFASKQCENHKQAVAEDLVQEKRNFSEIYIYFIDN